MLLRQGRQIQLQGVAGEEGEVLRPRHGLRQHRQQGPVQLHGHHFSRQGAQLAGEAPDAGADLQYAAGGVRAAGGGDLAGDPVLDKKVLPHGLGEAEAMAAQQGADLPDVAEIHR